MSLQSFVPNPKFEDYKEAFKHMYKLDRREDGVILAQAHTKGGPIQLSVENHRSVGQLFRTIGADTENEILIFTGSGDEFMMDADPEGFTWIDANDAPRNVFSFLRRATRPTDSGAGATDTGADLVCVANFAAQPHHDYRLPLPAAGTWEEVVNTDAESYTGSGVGNLGSITATGDDEGAAATLVLPPLATIWLRHRP